jgi:hypothetical protein
VVVIVLAIVGAPLIVAVHVNGTADVGVTAPVRAARVSSPDRWLRTARVRTARVSPDR